MHKTKAMTFYRNATEIFVRYAKVHTVTEKLELNLRLFLEQLNTKNPRSQIKPDPYMMNGRQEQQWVASFTLRLVGPPVQAVPAGETAG